MTTAAAEQSSTTDPIEAGPFAALRLRTFRIYLSGHAVASTGAWIQSIALDWLVLELSGTPSAVGIVMACQFLPMLLLGMYGGLVADRFPKRTVLLLTQSLNAAVSATIAALTITGVVRVEHLYLLALAGGLVFVVDNPARQVFVNEVVPAGRVRQAIAINAATFQASRLLGPAVAVVLIGSVGTGWAFAANAVSFLFPIVGLLLIRPAQLQPAPVIDPGADRLRDALRHVAARPRVAATIVLVGFVGTFGLNFPIVLTAMASSVFGGGAGLYGLFNIVIAVGSVGGALVATTVRRPGMRVLLGTAAAFGLAQAAAALAPGIAVFLVLLIVVGVANLAFQAMANASVQSWVEPAVRGRVMGLYMLVFAGGTPVGAPIIGALTAAYGARAGMAICGIVPLAACIGLVLLQRRSGRADGRALPTAARPEPDEHADERDGQSQHGVHAEHLAEDRHGEQRRRRGDEVQQRADVHRGAPAQQQEHQRERACRVEHAEPADGGPAAEVRRQPGDVEEGQHGEGRHQRGQHLDEHAGDDGRAVVEALLVQRAGSQ